MKILTVSIAAYNMEQFIEETLGSLMDERIMDDLEVFVVDDGGQDRTLDIAKEYAAKYPGSIIPVHKENGGYGTTVNYSIAHATGRYFKTLDGDDWFDREGLYQLMQVLKTTDADVVVTQTCEECAGEARPHAQPQAGGNVPAAPKAICDEANLEILGHHRIAYKTEILRKSQVKLPGRVLYTDSIYMTVPFTVAKTIQFIDVTAYHYRLDREGQSCSKESRIKHKGDQKEVLRFLMSFSMARKREGHPNYGYIKKVVVMFYLYTVKSLLFQRATGAARREIMEFEAEMKGLSEDVYLDAAACRGGTSLFLSCMRRTNYYAYWLIGLIPERLKK